ncbi:hypothetical protein AJ79_07872 [Helicocarpus griseus UAMH5409]|uniref:Uncharacterized protein n=1 Tax=Helicocarpus griseus UAMH5409 TaxID=1447875 RepID=A0A2B7WQH9_9EURO|nr:hypothetical protein AJ79_07872 [Helicocarpus griseus UAMH5409]
MSYNYNHWKGQNYYQGPPGPGQPPATHSIFGTPTPNNQQTQQQQRQPHPNSPHPPRSLIPKPHPPEVTQSISAVHTFWAKCASTKCHHCHTPLLNTFFDVVAWLKRWTSVAGSDSSKASLICAAQCVNCNALTCLGCGRESNKAAPVRTVQGCYLQWCCRYGRMFVIWVMLARYDLMEIDVQYSVGNNNNSNCVRNSLRPAGTLDSRGIGVLGAIDFKDKDRLLDGVTEMMADVVTELISTWHNKNLPAELRAMLQLSMLVDRATDLLRNDSIEEVSKRAGVYGSVLRFVQKLNAHAELSDLVRARGYGKRSSAGLQTICEIPAGDRGKAAREMALILGEKIPPLAEKIGAAG